MFRQEGEELHSLFQEEYMVFIEESVDGCREVLEEADEHIFGGLLLSHPGGELHDDGFVEEGHFLFLQRGGLVGRYFLNFH